MSIDSDSTAESEQTVETLAGRLGEAISELPEYQRFLDAEAAVEDDEETQAEIADFERQREAFLRARERGEATNEDLRNLQAAQERLHGRPVMSDFLEAQNDLELRLQALNAHVSEPLAVDFGEMAGGCCQD